MFEELNATFVITLHFVNFNIFFGFSIRRFHFWEKKIVTREEEEEKEEEEEEERNSSLSSSLSSSSSSSSSSAVRAVRKELCICHFWQRGIAESAHGQWNGGMSAASTMKTICSGISTLLGLQKKKMMKEEEEER